MGQNAESLISETGQLIVVVSLAVACQRDVGLTSTVSIRTALSSATSDVVFVQVEAEQGGETQRATPMRAPTRSP